MNEHFRIRPQNVVQVLAEKARSRKQKTKLKLGRKLQQSDSAGSQFIPAGQSFNGDSSRSSQPRRAARVPQQAPMPTRSDSDVPPGLVTETSCTGLVAKVL